MVTLFMRHAPIVVGRGGRYGGTFEAILPRTGEIDQLDRSASSGPSPDHGGGGLNRVIVAVDGPPALVLFDPYLGEPGWQRSPTAGHVVADEPGHHGDASVDLNPGFLG